MTKQHTYVWGQDNGYTASIVILDAESETIAHIEPYPRDNEKRLYELMKEYMPVYAVTEWPFMSITFKHVASSNFEILGRFNQTCDILGIKHDAVRSTTWRKELGIKAKGREQQKEASIQRAQLEFDALCRDKLKSEKRQRLNGHLVPVTFYDDNKCESALIAKYALSIWRKENA